MFGCELCKSGTSIFMSAIEGLSIEPPVMVVAGCECARCRFGDRSFLSLMQSHLFLNIATGRMTTLSKDNVVCITQIWLNCNGRIQTLRAGGIASCRGD